MYVSSIALGGLKAAETRLNRVEAGIAAGPAVASTDTLDLSQEAVALLDAKQNYEANLRTLRVADEMTRDTLDLIA
jgi:flagellar basal body rod protein FlgG